MSECLNQSASHQDRHVETLDSTLSGAETTPMPPENQAAEPSAATTPELQRGGADPSTSDVESREEFTPGLLDVCLRPIEHAAIQWPADMDVHIMIKIGISCRESKYGVEVPLGFDLDGVWAPQCFAMEDSESVDPIEFIRTLVWGFMGIDSKNEDVDGFNAEAKEMLLDTQKRCLAIAKARAAKAKPALDATAGIKGAAFVPPAT